MKNTKSKFIILFSVIFIVFALVGVKSYWDLQEHTSLNPTSPNSLPIASESPNTRCYLIGIEESHTLRGSNFTLVGYTQYYNDINDEYENYSLPVYPIVNGVSYNSNPNLTVWSGEVGVNKGVFRISIPVSATYDNDVNITVNANILSLPSLNIYVSSLTMKSADISHDITALSKLEVYTDITSPKFPGDVIRTTYKLTDNESTPFTNPLESDLQYHMSFYLNGNITQPNATGLLVDIHGNGFHDYTLGKNVTSLGIYFNGSKRASYFTYFEYEPVSLSVPILRASNMTGTVNIVNGANSSETYLYPDQDVQLSGNVLFNGEYAAANVPVNIYMNGEFLKTVTTDSQGNFAYNFNLGDTSFSGTGQSITFSVGYQGYDDVAFTPTQFSSSNSIIVNEAPAPPPTTDVALPPSETTNNWAGLILPIGIIVGVVVGLIFFQRKRMDLIRKRDLLGRQVDKFGKFNVVKSLYDSNKRREAIAYTFKIYSDLVYERYKFKKEQTQSLRDFAIMMVTKYGQDPLHVYPYIQLIEHIIYGGLIVDIEEFNKSIEIFGRIFMDLTGSQLQYNFGTMTQVVATESPAPSSS